MSIGQDERPRGGGVRASGGGFCTRAGDGGPGGCAGATTVCSLCQDFRICGAMPEGGGSSLRQVRTPRDHVVAESYIFFYTSMLFFFRFLSLEFRF